MYVYIYRQYRRYIPAARYWRTLALRAHKLDINWRYMYRANLVLTGGTR